ncbi:hypothetical protein [Alcaligenes faecalis]|nr:hypothetical protein [Alcaligenes faecalis]MCR4144300.1 hypothetical protein [Alcaligenes faecalis]
MRFQQKMQPLYVAGIAIGAPAMPEWVIALCALVLIGISGWMFWSDRK